MQFMTQMQERGLQPDVKTFTTAINACARENQLNRALSLIERMYKLDIKPDVVTYNVLLQACDKQGKVEIIEQLITQMPQLGVEPNLVNYNTAVRALCRGGQLNKVTAMLSMMRKREVEPSFSTYRAAVNGSCEGGHIDLAVSFLDQMKAEGYTPGPPPPRHGWHGVPWRVAMPSLAARCAQPTYSAPHLSLAPPWPATADDLVQYALLSTCGDEERPFLERSLEVTTEEVFETRARAERAAARSRYEAAEGRDGYGRGRGRGRGRGGRGVGDRRARPSAAEQVADVTDGTSGMGSTAVDGGGMEGLGLVDGLEGLGLEADSPETTNGEPSGASPAIAE